jgi:hypothetical protein
MSGKGFQLSERLHSIYKNDNQARTPQKDDGVNAGAPEGSNYCSRWDTHPIRNPVLSHKGSKRRVVARVGRMKRQMNLHELFSKFVQEISIHKEIYLNVMI